MANSTVYEESKPHLEIVQEIMDRPEFTEFEPLRRHGVNLSVVSKQKEDKDGNPVPVGDPTETRRVSGLLGAFIDADFIIVFDRTVFDNADHRAQEAMFHRALCAIDVTEKGLAKRRPDVVEYGANLGRFGDLVGSLSLAMRRAVFLTGKDPSLILQLDEPPTPEPEDTGVDED